MKWIRDERRPTITDQLEVYGKSDKVIVLIDDTEPLVAEYNRGTTINGEYWEQWYCPAYEDAVEGVTAWCDCIPSNS
jgi:hypothetical protein